MDEQELSDMDAIQLALDVHLKKNIYNSQRLFFKQQELSEASYPLLISYLTWLRKIKATPNQFDVMHQNEQKNRDLKFLCKRNLLFFLTVTGQFNVIEKLFKTPSFTPKLHHLITLIKKERHKIRQKKSTLLKETFLPKVKSRNWDQKHNAYCLPKMNLFNHDLKQTYQLLFAYTVRRIKIFYLVYISKIELLRKILKAIQSNPNLHAHIKKTLLHQITTIHRRASKNKALFTAPINQNTQTPTPKAFEFILQTWKQLHDDVLEINSIFNQCEHLSSEFKKIPKDEIATSMKLIDELENLMQVIYELHDEIDLEKTHNASAEDSDLSFSMQSIETPIDGPLSKLAEECGMREDAQLRTGEVAKMSHIKDSPFMSHHLTFFSTPQKREQSMSLGSHFNFTEQKTENNIRAGC